MTRFYHTTDEINAEAIDRHGFADSSNQKFLGEANTRCGVWVSDCPLPELIRHGPPVVYEFDADAAEMADYFNELGEKLNGYKMWLVPAEFLNLRRPKRGQ